MLSKLSILLFALSGLGVVEDRPSKSESVPKPLINAITNRSRAKSAKLRYNVRLELDGYAVPRMEYWEDFFVGNSILREERCDPDGIRVRDPATGDATLGVTGSCLPERSLADLDSKIRWSHPAGVEHLTQYQRPLRPDYRDPRIAGLQAGWDQRMAPSDVLDEILKDKGPWTVRAEGSLVRVASRLRNSNEESTEVEWLIDPDKDYAVLSCQITRHEPNKPPTVSLKSVTDYAVQDGRWWPTRSETLSPGSKYRIVITFESVEFDRPDHPKKLTPDLLGLPIGVAVQKIGQKGVAKSERLFYIGQGQTVSEDEWERIKQTFDLTARDAFYEQFRHRASRGHFPPWWDDASGSFGISDVAGKPDDWELYVRRWIVKRRPGATFEPVDPLDEKQINSAWAILEDCRKQARAILDRDGEANNKGPGTTSRPATTRPVKDPRIPQIFGQLTHRLEGILREQQVGSAPPIKDRSGPTIGLQKQ